MKLKRYDQYINEDLTPMSLDAEIEMPEMEEMEETGDSEVPPMNMDAEILMNEEPEEEHDTWSQNTEFKGDVLMKELENRLISEIEEKNLPGQIRGVGNSVIYEGVEKDKKEISFYSETGKFAINRKGKYDTVDDVIEQLKK